MLRGLGVVDAGRGKAVARALDDRVVARIAVVDLQVGAALLGLGQGLEVFVGETDAAIGAAAIDAEVVSGHAGSLLSIPASTGWTSGADHNAKATHTKVG